MITNATPIILTQLGCETFYEHDGHARFVCGGTDFGNGTNNFTSSKYRTFYCLGNKL